MTQPLPTDVVGVKRIALPSNNMWDIDSGEEEEEKGVELGFHSPPESLS